MRAIDAKPAGFCAASDVLGIGGRNHDEGREAQEGSEVDSIDDHGQLPILL